MQDSEFVLGLQLEARTLKLPINVGIHEPAQGGEKVKNTLIWIDEQGAITQRYQKLHLFDVDIKDGPVLKESRYVYAVNISSNRVIAKKIAGKERREGNEHHTTVQHLGWTCRSIHLLRCGLSHVLKRTIL